MALAIGTPSTYNSSSASTTHTLSSFTVGAGTNRLLVVTVSTRGGPVTGVTFGGVAMTSAVSSGAALLEASIWYLIAPSVSTANIVATISASNHAKISAVVYTDSNQTSPISDTSINSGTSTTPSVVVTSATGEICQDSLAFPDNGSGVTPSPDGGQTSLFVSDFAGDTRGCSSHESGAGSVTMGWTIRSEAWVHVGVSVAPTAPPLVFTGAGSGKMLATIYAAGGAGTYVGTLPVILSAWVKRAVGQIGAFEITVPAIDVGLANATQGREIVITREEDGDIFRGVIMGKRYDVDAQERYVCTLSGLSLAVELHWQSTYMGVLIDNQTAAAAADLVLSGSGWTDLQTGAGFVSMSDRYDNMSLWQAMERFTETQGAYMRETATARQVEIKRGTTASGIRLLAPEYVTPEMGDNPLIGFIESITAHEDGEGIVNRLVPFGLDEGNLVFDLGDSTRVTPYTVQNFTKNRPSITHVLKNSMTGTGPTAEPTAHTWTAGMLNATGMNRMAVVFVAAEDTYQRNGFVKVGGVESVSQQAITLDGNRLQMFLARNIGEGELQVDYKFDWENASPSWISLIAVAVQDVDQRLAVTTAIANGTSTTPSVTLAGDANDLRIGGVSSSTDFASPTSGPNQTRLETELTQTNSDLAVDRTFDNTDSSISWTFGTSEVWAAMAIRFLGARTYYIEDSASITAYGRRTSLQIEDGSKLVGGTAAQLIATGNTLYDLSSTRLARLKDPVTFYEVRASYIGAISWLVGDSIRVDYQGFTDDGVWLSVNTDLIVMERTENFGEDGVRRWELTLATQYRDPPSDSDLFAQQVERIMALEGAR